VVGIGLCLVLADASSKAVQVVVLFICGCGIGPLFPCLIVAIQASVERKDLATVSTLNNFFRMTGSGFGVAINGALFQNYLNNALQRSNVPEAWAELAKSSAQRIVEIPDEELRRVVEDIYLRSMKTVFTALIPMAAMMFVLTFGVQHVRLNVKTTTPPTSSSDEKEANSTSITSPANTPLAHVAVTSADATARAAATEEVKK
jgi:MFS family permease